MGVPRLASLAAWTLGSTWAAKVGSPRLNAHLDRRRRTRSTPLEMNLCYLFHRSGLFDESNPQPSHSHADDAETNAPGAPTT